MDQRRKVAAERVHDRGDALAVQLRIPEALLTVLDARVDALNTDPMLPQWTRTKLILHVLGDASRRWKPVR